MRAGNGWSAPRSTVGGPGSMARAPGVVPGARRPPHARSDAVSVAASRRRHCCRRCCHRRCHRCRRRCFRCCRRRRRCRRPRRRRYCCCYCCCCCCCCCDAAAATANIAHARDRVGRRRGEPCPPERRAPCPHAPAAGVQAATRTSPCAARGVGADGHLNCAQARTWSRTSVLRAQESIKIGLWWGRVHDWRGIRAVSAAGRHSGGAGARAHIWASCPSARSSSNRRS